MMKSATACVVGGGPAGMVLGLLLARAGVEVTVLERHADFLRDFRGDTVHPATLTLLDELGLGERFATLPQRHVQRISAQLDGGAAQLADFGRLPGRHPYIALVPQWDFLDLLAAAAAEEPSFTLHHNAEVVGLLRQGPVTGVRWRDRLTGEEHTLEAALTVACDGRFSTVRAAAGLAPRSFGVPIDVVWFRLPRTPGDPEGGIGRVSGGQIVVLIDRGEYWQCGYLIRKGSLAALQEAGIGELRSRLARLVPWLDGRLDGLASWDDVSLLNVELNRLRRWSVDGLVLIGDAAHAMSPVGGVGINLAVADAVATARLLGPALARRRRVTPWAAHLVQLRRWLPTVLTQTAQRFAHRAVLGRTLAAAPPTHSFPRRRHQLSARSPVPLPAPAGAAQEPSDAAAAQAAPGAPAPVASGMGLPLPLRLLQRFPVLQGIPARLVGIGPLPEHAPSWARR